MKQEMKTRIRATGDGAGRVRAYLAERIPEAEIVGADDPAEFVMTTCEDFDEALEDAAAAAAFARTRGEERLPIESVDRLLSGESPVRVWREHRRMSLAALAGQAGIGKGYLSQIENGERTGTIDTMKKLAGALGLELDDLV
jgi:ribosome-binding protein aMBF1 (putative translation factor)